MQASKQNASGTFSTNGTVKWTEGDRGSQYLIRGYQNQHDQSTLQAYDYGTIENLSLQSRGQSPNQF